MRKDCALGPDGFGPAFYQATWSTIGPDIIRLARDFHEGIADLNRINKAYISLLPKKSALLKPADFRPISLQNCHIKGISKVVMSRLQPPYALLVHSDQSDFIKGRFILENFVYATDMVQICHKRRARPSFSN